MGRIINLALNVNHIGPAEWSVSSDELVSHKSLADKGQAAAAAAAAAAAGGAGGSVGQMEAPLHACQTGCQRV